jgi:hypothetical protein
MAEKAPALKKNLLIPEHFLFSPMFFTGASANPSPTVYLKIEK